MALFLAMLEITLPLFIMIGAGWAMSAYSSISEETLSRILVDFFMPLLVFVSLYESSVALADMGSLMQAVFFIAALQFVSVWLYGRISRRDTRGMALSVLFMNSGFIGFPLMQLWGGAEALNIEIVWDQFSSMLLFTLGFIILGGGISRKGLGHSLRSPILWAAVSGFLFNILNIPVPGTILKVCHFAGGAAPPLAAFVVGVSLTSRLPRISSEVLWGIGLRMAGGLLLGFAAVELFNLKGPVATVVFVSAALPSAVFSYVLPSRYGLDSSVSQSIVILSTALSIITIPLSFMLAAALFY